MGKTFQEQDNKTNYTEYQKDQKQALEKLKKLAIKNVSVDKNQVLKAVKALAQIKSKNENQLFNEDFIYLEISLDKIPLKYSIRPVQMQYFIKDRLYIRFSVKNQALNTVFLQKNPSIADLNVPQIARVISVKKVAKKFPTYKEKRELFYSYDMFFCDYKIYDLLKEPLGKVFFERKKIPFPIDCEDVPQFENAESYEEYINNLSNYTYFSMRNGPVYVIKVARQQMKNGEKVKNIINSIYSVIPHLLKDKTVKTQHVRQISLKLADSISLPIYTKLSAEEIRIYKSQQ